MRLYADTNKVLFTIVLVTLALFITLAPDAASGDRKVLSQNIWIRSQSNGISSTSDYTYTLYLPITANVISHAPPPIPTPTPLPSNNPPSVPSGPSPAASATNQDININLDWYGEEPDGDRVTYDVYLEAEDRTPENLVCEDVEISYCYLGYLSHDTHYYWKVRATDEQGTTSVGPIWDFTTEPAFIIPPSRYGRHYPNGNAAVKYIYSSDGMWKEINPAEYIWNYYQNCATASHPYNRQTLINTADGTRFFTTRDANCHLLLDWNHDGEIDTARGGYAFHEHNGKGVNGQTQGNPFTNFWFDDNWLARYMSEAYNRRLPNGLSQYADFNRWQILGGDTTNWMPYGDDDYDRLALDGLYYLWQGHVNSAIQRWDRIRDKSGYFYDYNNQRYDYPNINENYHMGLFEILTGFLLDHASMGTTKRNEILQHWVSLRSNILSNQEVSGSNLYGWRTHIDNTGTLINTETIAVNVLALGVGAVEVFEAGRLPLHMNDNNYFMRSHNVLSAVLESSPPSSPGHMTFGPYRHYPVGTYVVDFFLRAPSPEGKLATIDIYDADSHQILSSRDVWASDMASGNQWSQFTLRVSVTNSENNLEFRTYWHGTSNMDVASIRIRVP